MGNTGLASTRMFFHYKKGSLIIHFSDIMLLVREYSSNAVLMNACSGFMLIILSCVFSLFLNLEFVVSFAPFSAVFGIMLYNAIFKFYVFHSLAILLSIL